MYKLLLFLTCKENSYMILSLNPNSLLFKILSSYSLPTHAPSNFLKKVDCHQDKSGIHNTLTQYSGWCLKMRWAKALSAAHGVRKALSERHSLTWCLSHKDEVVVSCTDVTTEVQFEGFSDCHAAACNSFWNKVGLTLMGRQRERGKVWCSCHLRCVVQGGMSYLAICDEASSLKIYLWVLNYGCILPSSYFSAFPKFLLVIRIKLLV